MAPLHALAALYTAADRNIKAPDKGAPHDLFLILGFDPFYGQGPAARGALRGNWNGDRFVYMVRDRPAVVFAVRFSWFASRGFPLTLPLASRKRRGLALGSTLRAFQLLLQARILFPQSRIVVLQTLLLAQCLVKLFPCLAQALCQFFDPGNWTQRFEIEKQITL